MGHGVACAALCPIMVMQMELCYLAEQDTLYFAFGSAEDCFAVEDDAGIVRLFDRRSGQLVGLMIYDLAFRLQLEAVPCDPFAEIGGEYDSTD